MEEQTNELQRERHEQMDEDGKKKKNGSRNELAKKSENGTNK